MTANHHKGPTPAMLQALALVADGVSQRKASAAAGVSLAGLVKALKRLRGQA
jgi:hypothetical protein